MTEDVQVAFKFHDGAGERMAATLRFLDALHSEEVTEQAAPSIDEARLDASAILASFQLQTIRRYFNQIHWLSETAEAINSDAVEPGLKLESVAAHSWHVADTALLVAPHFGWIDLSRVTSLAMYPSGERRGEDGAYRG